MNLKKIVLILIICVSCKSNIRQKITKVAKKNDTTVVSKKMSFEEQLIAIKKGTSNDSILSNDYDFIFNDLLKGKVKLDISKYENLSEENKCYPIRYKKETLFEFQEGLQSLGDLDGDKIDDYVFVLFPLNECEEGESYYFSNNFPRILTDSNCCHPSSILNIGDIDEDGFCEVAQYYSSCASKYKSFNIWTLKNSKWILVTNFTYLLNDEYEDFQKLFKKISKNKLKYLEIYDENEKGKLLKEWKTITIK